MGSLATSRSCAIESELMTAARASLIRLLQLAYSGELAAALAYAGHARATRDPLLRLRIAEIELEELHHRSCVGDMLRSLAASPDPRRERRAAFIGRTLGLLCHVSGRLAPLWGAGRLERKNIVEYENAARYAADAGLGHLVEPLLTMAEIEWEHERFFREELLRYRIGKLLPRWTPPPRKEEIRASFPRTVPQQDGSAA